MKTALLQIINTIPEGKVVSYGQVATELGIKYDIQTSGRLVGRTLSQLKQDEWHNAWQRVVNQQGYISTLKLGERGLVQIQLLRKEGVEVKEGYIDMKKFGYKF